LRYIVNTTLSRIK